MASQGSSQVNGTRAFGSVETPDCFWHVSVHINGFAAVAPAWSNRKAHSNTVLAEFLSTHCRFGNPADARVSNNTFNRFAIRIFKIFRD